MRWKEIIIGAIVTLLITVIGGIAVWKFTKEPPKPDPKADVVYEYDSPANFKSEYKSLVFNTFRIGNRGNQTAHEVMFSIVFPRGTKIQDFAISNSSGAAARANQTELSSKENEKTILIKSLTPSEVVTVSILTSDYAENALQLSARYSEGVAEKGSLVNRPIQVNSDVGPKAKEAAFSALLLGLLLPVMLYRLRNALGGVRSLNNSAFMMLHQGLISDATKMLEKELSTRGASAFELANLGLCKALGGDREYAEKMFSAAEMYSPTSHIKALTAFNRAISYFEAGESDKAKQQLDTAVRFSKSRIKKYIKLSIYGQEIVDSIDGFEEYSSKKS